MENPTIQNLLDQAWQDYDPNNDVPSDVRVTFADPCFLEICTKQQEYIEGLQVQIDQLKKELEELK